MVDTPKRKNLVTTIVHYNQKVKVMDLSRSMVIHKLTVVHYLGKDVNLEKTKEMILEMQILVEEIVKVLSLNTSVLYKIAITKIYL